MYDFYHLCPANGFAACSHSLLIGRKNVQLEAPESIQKVLQLHQSSLAFYHKCSTRDSTATYTVTYHLKNGKTLSRTLPYSNQTLDIKAGEEVPFFIHFDYSAENELVRAYREVQLLPEVLEKSNPVFLNASAALMELRITSSEAVCIINTSAIEEVMRCLRQDLLDASQSITAGSVDSSFRIHFYYTKNPEATNQKRLIRCLWICWPKCIPMARAGIP